MKKRATRQQIIDGLSGYLKRCKYDFNTDDFILVDTRDLFGIWNGCQRRGAVDTADKLRKFGMIINDKFDGEKALPTCVIQVRAGQMRALNN